MDAEIYLYFGDLDRPFDLAMMGKCPRRPARPNALLLLDTNGGDPNAAYRITRHFRTCHSNGKLFLFVGRACKSAGTLVALGADALIMSDEAELGPLDTQIDKPDEIGEHQSGLVVMQALKTLQEESFELFENCFLQLRQRSGLRITTRTAAELASMMTTGLFGPVYAQIDPLRLGENYRALQVALMYGQRLSTDNVEEETIRQLISSFPSHGFVIDRKEATDLFKEVREPSDAQQRLFDYVRPTIPSPGDEPFVRHLTGGDDTESEEETESAQENGEHADQSTREGDEIPTFASTDEQRDGKSHQ